MGVWVEVKRQQAMVSSVNTPSWQLPKMNLFQQPTSLNQLEHWSKALLARIQITPAVIKNTSLNHTDAGRKFCLYKKKTEKTMTVWLLWKHFSGEGTAALL